MSHDEPFAGKTVNADRAYYLDTSGAYTPELTVDTGTDPDLGADGEAVGSWHRNGHLITFFARFLFSGTGVSAGSGSYLISVPFDADASVMEVSTTAAGATHIGIGFLRDNSATSNSVGCFPYFRTAAAVGMRLDGTVGTVSSSAPFGWADGDRISISGTYIADPAGLPT